MFNSVYNLKSQTISSNYGVLVDYLDEWKDWLLYIWQRKRIAN